MLNNSRGKRQLKADLLLLMVVAIWGTTFPIMKIVLVEIDPFYYIALRFFVAFISLLIIFNKHLKGVGWPSLKKAIILGGWLFGGYSFQIVGLQYTTASRSGFITGLAVVFVPLLAIIFFKKIPGIFNWVGIILAVAGLFLLAGIGDKEINYGDFLTLLCAFSFGMQIVLLSKYLKNEDPVVMAVIQMGVVTTGAFLVTIFTGGLRVVTLETGGVVIYTGLLATALAYLVQSYAQQFTSSTHAALIFTMEPVFAAFFAFLILGETMGLSGLIGGVLIVTGMLVAELGHSKKNKRMEDK